MHVVCTSRCAVRLINSASVNRFPRFITESTLTFTGRTISSITTTATHVCLYLVKKYWLRSTTASSGSWCIWYCLQHEYMLLLLMMMMTRPRFYTKAANWPGDRVVSMPGRWCQCRDRIAPRSTCLHFYVLLIQLPRPFHFYYDNGQLRQYALGKTKAFSMPFCNGIDGIHWKYVYCCWNVFIHISWTNLLNHCTLLWNLIFYFNYFSIKIMFFSYQSIAYF